MILYLMRHGEAISAGEWDGADKSRPLSPRGEKELEAASVEWTRLRFSPQTILTSPLKRAQQTSAYVSHASSGLTTIIPELFSGVKPEQIRAVITQPQWIWPLLYVGHMPDLAFMSSRLTHQAELMDASIQTGEILAFEAEPCNTGWGNWRLLWRRQLKDWKNVKEI